MSSAETSPDTTQGRQPRKTAQGAAIREVLREHDGFMSAQDVFTTLRARGYKVGLSTVYRHLQTLTENRDTDSIYTHEGETTYRLCGTVPENHHHHLVCRACGRAQEVEGRPIERWAAQVAAQHGYSDVDHTIEIFGLCPSCSTT